AAVELFTAREYDIVLMDVQMPVMDGFETAKRIKEMFPEKNIPIMFISAVYTQDPYIHKGYEVGGLDYIPKPFQPDVLKAKVRLHTEVYKKSKILELMEKQLGETASRYKLLLDHIPDVVCTTSLEGKLTFLNKAFEHCTGYKPEDWVGKTLAPLFDPDDLPNFRAAFEKTVKDRHDHIFKARILAQSGNSVPVEGHLGLLIQHSLIEGVVCVIRGLPRKDSPRQVIRQKVGIE
ncbi:MAG TPA: response regulator, partial [bacterium]|nr:response regulator [bacterium]